MWKIWREMRKYMAFMATLPKISMAYQAGFWVGLALNTIGMTILYFFWRAVYGEAESISGLTQQSALNYILLAQIFIILTDSDLIFDLGFSLREGYIIHHLLRPVGFQGMYYAQGLGKLLFSVVLQIPIALIARLFFGLAWPTDPAVWAAFVVSALLGWTVLFFFYWTLACLAFYTTEVWGLGVLVTGLSLFLSGALVPLAMMPDWLSTIVLSIPFAQALAVPLGLLTGITPLSDAPRVWLTQLAWVVGMGVVSMTMFRVSVRKITVQGG